MEKQEILNEILEHCHNGSHAQYATDKIMKLLASSHKAVVSDENISQEESKAIRELIESQLNVADTCKHKVMNWNKAGMILCELKLKGYLRSLLSTEAKGESPEHTTLSQFKSVMDFFNTERICTDLTGKDLMDEFKIYKKSLSQY